MRVEVVPAAPCPDCGACADHPVPTLNFPNRPKVEEGGTWYWRCYNPNCSTEYYAPRRTRRPRRPPTTFSF